MPSDEVIVNATLAGTREYNANAQKLVYSNEEIAASTKLVGREMEATSRRGYIMNQALFTTRRLLYASTLAFVGMGAVMVKWGFDFRSAMQSARVALAPVFSNARSLNRELTYLFNFTKYTPFQFKDVTIAFRQMFLGMRTIGVSALDVNRYLKAMTDALSAVGRTSPGALNRVAVALQHMAFQGRLTGQVVLQLARDGLPVYAALKTELGLTADQIHNIGKLGIPAKTALDAITRYIETTPGLMDAARHQAIHTFHGLFTTFKDNMSQLMSAVESGWFNRMQHNFARMNKFFDTIANQMQHAHSATAMAKILNDALTPGGGIMMIWVQLRGAIHDFWVTFSTLITDLFKSKTLWATVYLGLVLLHGALSLTAKYSHTLATVIKILLPLWIAFHIYTKLNAIWLGIFKTVEISTTKTTKEMTFAQILLNGAMRAYYLGLRGLIVLIGIWNVAIIRSGRGVNGQFVAMTALEKGVLSLRLRLLSLIETINATRLGWLGLRALPPLALLAVLSLIPHVTNKNPDPNAPSRNPVQHWLEKQPVIGGLTSQVGHLSDAIYKRLHRWHVPGFAAGGWTPYSGQFMVGENGPELATLPGGTQITPNSQLGFNRSEAWMQKMLPPLTINLMLDRQKLESVIVDLQSGRIARA